MSRIQKHLDSLNGKKALVAFYTAGDPNLDASKDIFTAIEKSGADIICLLYTSPSPRDRQKSRMPSSA